jgi:hypothetical protein
MWAQTVGDGVNGSEHGARLYIGHGACTVEVFDVCLSDGARRVLQFAHLKTVQVNESIPVVSLVHVGGWTGESQGVITHVFSDVVTQFRVRFADSRTLFSAGDGLIGWGRADTAESWLVYIPDLHKRLIIDKPIAAKSPLDVPLLPDIHDQLSPDTPNTAIPPSSTAEDLEIQRMTYVIGNFAYVPARSWRAALAAPPSRTLGAIVSVLFCGSEYWACTSHQRLPVSGYIVSVRTTPGRNDMYMICGNTIVRVWNFHSLDTVRLEILASLPDSQTSNFIPLDTP